MYILFALFLTASGSVTVTTQEFTSISSCVVAKQQIESTLPTAVSYANYHTLTCVAK